MSHEPSPLEQAVRAHADNESRIELYAREYVFVWGEAKNNPDDGRVYPQTRTPLGKIINLESDEIDLLFDLFGIVAFPFPHIIEERSDELQVTIYSRLEEKLYELYSISVKTIDKHEAMRIAYIRHINKTFFENDLEELEDAALTTKEPEPVGLLQIPVLIEEETHPKPAIPPPPKRTPPKDEFRDDLFSFP
jgi:hypothetical protein